VLKHPVTAAPPDLKHFRLDAATVARQQAEAEAVATNRAARDRRSSVAIVLLAGWLLGAAAITVLWRFRQALPRWARRAGIVAVPAALIAMSSGIHDQPTAQPTSAQPTSTILPVRAPAAVTRPQAAPALFASAPAWQELVAVENELARTQDTLTRQESQIRMLAANPATAAPAPAPSVGAAPPAGDFETRAQRRVALLLNEYEQAAAIYQQTLKREYDIYRGAAQDSSRKQQIVAAAASTPKPGVKDAVTYNLALVEAQVEQENAINAAEAKLQAIGSLSGSQLNAIRHHQAFIIPVEAPVIQGFGPTDFGLEPAINFHGAFYPHFHTGIDIVGAENSPVHAAADGVVLLANSSHDAQGHYTGYGNYVVIAHPDGFATLYGHLNAFSVKAGDVVHQGQILGLEGSTGLSTGPHVHFEIRHNGEWVDPMAYLTGQART